MAHKRHADATAAIVLYFAVFLTPARFPDQLEGKRQPDLVAEIEQRTTGRNVADDAAKLWPALNANNCMLMRLAAAEGAPLGS